MRRYIQRYIHHIGGLPDFSALRFTKYNQYESMILPLQRYLEKRGVVFDFGVKVIDCKIEEISGKKAVTSFTYEKDGKTETKQLTNDDFFIVTNGCCTDV